MKLILSGTASRITRLNKKEKVWLGTFYSEQTVTPNITRKSFKITLELNEFGEEPMSEELAGLIIEASTEINFCLNVEDSTFGFYPIFSLLYIPSISKKNREIIKWTRELIPETIQEELEKTLYLKSNKLKRALLNLEKLKEISHYEY